MGIIKNNTQPFAQIPLKLLVNNDISNGAKITYAYLESRSSMPDGWNFFNHDIKKLLGIKKDATIAKYLKELREAKWIDRKRNNTTKGYDYIVYADNTQHNSKRYEDLENRAKENPQALFLTCSNLLDGYEFSMPLNRLDLDLDANVHLHIRMDVNGYFYDLAEEYSFTKKGYAERVWKYLWQDRFNEVINEIKQNRR